jgi:hypothetical protein
LDFAVARQPLKNVLPHGPRGRVVFGKAATDQRPELARRIAECLMFWPYVETNMALVLGQLLGSQNAAALAVFQALRRSSAQRDAISEAARVSLSAGDNELVTAVINVHKGIEADLSMANSQFLAQTDRVQRS